MHYRIALLLGAFAALSACTIDTTRLPPGPTHENAASTSPRPNWHSPNANDESAPPLDHP